MALLNPLNEQVIRNLKLGEITFPEINYNQFEKLNRTKTTILAAYSNIQQHGPSEFLNNLNWDSKGDIEWQNEMLEFLYETINQLITEYRKFPSDNLLEKIFTYIQLWGGNAGRGIYVNGDRWLGNFDLTVYKKGVSLVLNSDYQSALKVLNSIKQMGISFSTKHIHFWSQGSEPIFDSIISKIVFGRKKPNANEYSHYIESIDKLIGEIDNPEITRMKVERTLFNWSETIDGKNWINYRNPK